MGICTILVLLFVILLFLTRKQSKNFGREKLVFKILHIDKWLKNDQYQLLMKQLYPTENEEQKFFEFWYKKIRNVALVIGVFLILGMISEVSVLLQHTNLFNGTFLTRPEYGEGLKTVSLEISNNKYESKKLDIDVLERTFGEEERNKAFEQAKYYIDSVYLGENESSNKIFKSLILPQRIPNTMISVSWTLDEEGILLEDGSINKEKLNEEKKEVEISAILKYQKWSKEYFYSLTIVPEKKTEEEKFWDSWSKSLSYLDKKTNFETYLSLPQEVNGVNVFYKETRKSKSIPYLILGIIGAVLAILQPEEKLKRCLKKREQELFLEYPGLVNKFALLLGAGMTIGGAFEKICLEYTKEKQKEEGKIKYAYEEMLITQKEIMNGVSEVKAYEQFGKRIKCLEYLKFSTLISQNLRKGSDRILELLELEAIEAFEKRKEYAKKQGEEAGTKLLVPMMLMLILVMAIIIIPAFLSF